MVDNMYDYYITIKGIEIPCDVCNMTPEWCDYRICML